MEREIATQIGTKESSQSIDRFLSIYVASWCALPLDFPVDVSFKKRDDREVLQMINLMGLEDSISLALHRG